MKWETDLSILSVADHLSHGEKVPGPGSSPVNSDAGIITAGSKKACPAGKGSLV
jgi:hypothetical protein